MGNQQHKTGHAGSLVMDILSTKPSESAQASNVAQLRQILQEQDKHRDFIQVVFNTPEMQHGRTNTFFARLFSLARDAQVQHGILRKEIARLLHFLLSHQEITLSEAERNVVISSGFPAFVVVVLGTFKHDMCATETQWLNSTLELVKIFARYETFGIGFVGSQGCSLLTAIMNSPNMPHTFRLNALLAVEQLAKHSRFEVVAQKASLDLMKEILMDHTGNLQGKRAAVNVLAVMGEAKGEASRTLNLEEMSQSGIVEVLCNGLAQSHLQSENYMVSLLRALKPLLAFRQDNVIQVPKRVTGAIVFVLNEVSNPTTLRYALDVVYQLSTVADYHPTLLGEGIFPAILTALSNLDASASQMNANSYKNGLATMKNLTRTVPYKVQLVQEDRFASLLLHMTLDNRNLCKCTLELLSNVIMDDSPDENDRSMQQLLGIISEAIVTSLCSLLQELVSLQLAPRTISPTGKPPPLTEDEITLLVLSLKMLCVLTSNEREVQACVLDYLRVDGLAAVVLKLANATATFYAAKLGHLLSAFPKAVCLTRLSPDKPPSRARRGSTPSDRPLAKAFLDRTDSECSLDDLTFQTLSTTHSSIPHTPDLCIHMRPGTATTIVSSNSSGSGKSSSSHGTAETPSIRSNNSQTTLTRASSPSTGSSVGDPFSPSHVPIPHIKAKASVCSTPRSSCGSNASNSRPGSATSSIGAQPGMSHQPNSVLRAMKRKRRAGPPGTPPLPIPNSFLSTTPHRAITPSKAYPMLPSVRSPPLSVGQ